MSGEEGGFGEGKERAKLEGVFVGVGVCWWAHVGVW